MSGLESGGLLLKREQGRMADVAKKAASEILPFFVQKRGFNAEIAEDAERKAVASRRWRDP